MEGPVNLRIDRERLAAWGAFTASALFILAVTLQ